MASPADKFLAYYSLADANNAHTSGPNLTAVNGPTHVTGKVGNGAEFDVTAQSGYIVANSSAGVFKPGTNSFSVAFWVNVSTLPSSGNAGALVHMGAVNSTDPGWHIVFNNSAGSGQFVARFSDGTTLYSATSSAIYTTGTWYHVSATWNRKDHLRLYVNGVQVVSTSIAAAASANVQPTQDFKIGGRHGTSVWFDGIIDEVLIYDGVMSADVRTMHRNGTTGNDYATIAAISRPFVSQEFIHEQETNTTHAETPVTGLVADQIVVAMLTADGNPTSPSVGAWDGSWNFPIDGLSPNSGTALTRTRVWWKTVTSTDVSTETEVRVDWTSNEKAVLITQLWENCAGMNAWNESDTASAASSYTENGVTTTVDGCRIVMGIGIDGGTVVNSVSPGIPFNEYQVTNSAGHCGLWFGSEDIATAGASGTYAITLNASANAVPFSFAMEPNAVSASGAASSSHELIALAAGAKTATGVAAAAHEFVGLSAGSKIAIGQANASHELISFAVYGIVRGGVVVVSDELTGQAAFASITRSGAVVASDEIIGYAVGGNSIVPSSITLSVSSLHKIGLTMAHIHKITLTISEVE